MAYIWYRLDLKTKLKQRKSVAYMLDNNLKQELLKAYNNVSKASKVEYNQQNLGQHRTNSVYGEP